MKLTLTLSESTELIRKALSLPKDEIFVVDINTDVHPLTIALRQVLKEFPLYGTTQKISAIKRFRELAPQVASLNYHGQNTMSSCIGLADAKWAVENVDFTFANLIRNGIIH